MSSGALVFNITSNCPEVQARLTQVITRLKDLRPVFQDFQGRMQRSISLNFQQGGRPEKWEPSKRALAKGRGAGKTGQTLRKSGILLNSLTGPGAYTAGPDFLEIATNVPYARTHQYGAKKGSFGTVTAKVGPYTVKGFLRKGGEVKQHTVAAHIRKGHPVKEHIVKTFLRPDVQVKEHMVKEHTRKMLLPWGDIPARRFLLVQNSDVTYLKRSIARYVLSAGSIGSAGSGEGTVDNFGGIA